MGKYFGTDGIRGVANSELTAQLAFRVGQAAATVLAKEAEHSPFFLIGRDTRLSGDMLEAALVAGICSTGASVSLLGVVPTPAVARLTVSRKADAGVVISASHNPFEHNGIKIFDSLGYKLNDDLEAAIEDMLDGRGEPPAPVGGAIGRASHDEKNAVEEYIEALAEAAGGDLKGMKIAVDCANGAASATAPELFRRLGADADIFFNAPSGVNINAGCGSTRLGALKKIVSEGSYDAGVAFDGDADRCLVVDERGEELDGDRIMGACGLSMLKKGELNEGVIVATILSNLGLHAYAKKNGMKIETCGVGDRFVLERMLEGGFDLGGEQSGHIIFRRFATTGDGQLTAVRFLRLLKESGIKCSELVSDIPKYPQLMINCTVPNKIKATVADDPRVRAAVEKAEAAFGGDGRVLVRPSGTEALVRVMAEGADDALTKAAAESVAEAVRACTE